MHVGAPRRRSNKDKEGFQSHVQQEVDGNSFRSNWSGFKNIASQNFRDHRRRAIEDHRRRVLIQTDSKPCIAAFLKSKLPWVFQSKWDCICRSLEQISFRHGFREINFSADAQQTKKFISAEISLSNTYLNLAALPNWNFQILLISALINNSVLASLACV